MATAAHPPLPADRSPVHRAASGPGGIRVLYVDDEPLLQRAASRLLRYAGASCVVAGTDDEAVARAAGDPELAVAILDFHMPEGPVGPLVERLRAERPALPLIGTSGRACPSEFARHGVTRFLEKPWTIGALSHAVGLAVRDGPAWAPR